MWERERNKSAIKSSRVSRRDIMWRLTKWRIHILGFCNEVTITMCLCVGLSLSFCLSVCREEAFKNNEAKWQTNKQNKERVMIMQFLFVDFFSRIFESEFTLIKFHREYLLYSNCCLCPSFSQFSHTHIITDSIKLVSYFFSVSFQCH